MNINTNKNFFHGIMFHHFHDQKKYFKSQGSIDKDDLSDMIRFIGRENILDADIFFERLLDNKLKDSDVCLTFDDGLKCQIDIAIPILEDFKIKSFFFIHTSIFTSENDDLELFRFFRTNYFDQINNFYKNFYQILNKDLKSFFKENDKKIKFIKKKFPFYSLEDINFRLVRDFFLTRSDYKKIMYIMMKNKNFDYKNFNEIFYFNNSDLNVLQDLGHSIGLHSHTHPTFLENLNFDDQFYEYNNCHKILNNILNKPKKKIKTMSHPCGSYNSTTLKILKKLGIQLGFKQSMMPDIDKGCNLINNSHLEIARNDHSEIFKMMKK